MRGDKAGSPVRPRDDPAWQALLQRAPPPSGPWGTLNFFNPLDQPFIAYLSKKYADRKAAEALRDRLGTMRREDYETRLGDGLTMNDPAFRSLAAEFADPAVFLEGKWACTLRLRTLATAMGYFQNLSPRFYEAPVIVLPSFELNGFVIRSPAGRPAIVLNSALLGLGLLHSTIYLASGLAHHRGELLDVVHDYRDYAETLIRLACQAFTGESDYLLGIVTFRNMPLDIPWSERATAVAQQFVLLHEFAHLAEDDLGAPRPDARTAMGLDEAVLSRSAQTELRADYHAAAALSCEPALRTLGVDKTQAASAVAVLIQFLALCDYIKLQLFGMAAAETHPAPELRLATALQAFAYQGAPVDEDHIARLLTPFGDAFARVDEIAAKRGIPSRRAVTQPAQLRATLFGPPRSGQ